MGTSAAWWTSRACTCQRHTNEPMALVTSTIFTVPNVSQPPPFFFFSRRARCPIFCKFQCVASEIVFQPLYPYTMCIDRALAPFCRARKRVGILGMPYSFLFEVTTGIRLLNSLDLLDVVQFFVRRSQSRGVRALSSGHTYSRETRESRDSPRDSRESRETREYVFHVNHVNT